MKRITFFIAFVLIHFTFYVSGQDHPEIYSTDNQREAFLNRVEDSDRVGAFVEYLKMHLEPTVERHTTDPEWIVSRLQMYWNSKYQRIYVNGMDFSHGEGTAPVATVRFSGSRDWATDYLKPALEDILPYMDDERGLYLQNGSKEKKPWEWVHPSETGHIIEGINREILKLAEDAAFLYWLSKDENYAVFASDILMKYIEGMYYRDPPLTVGDHKNALLMGLQTFEVIHEGIIEPVTVCYDFLYDYLVKTGKNVTMIQNVFRKWADQEIKYGVPDNNWNLMQARFITYLAIALENDKFYTDGKGQQYYLDQVLNQNSAKQKALKDVVKNYDSVTAIWPETAGYSTMVSDDLLEIYSLMDRTLNNHLLGDYPILEKAILANFQYLFPHDFTVAYGDAKHSRLRFNSFELLIAQYRKYNQIEKQTLITEQLNRFLTNETYDRRKIKSLFQLFFYVEELLDIPSAKSIEEMVGATFYSPNVSWIVQRNGHSLENGMMVSKNASLGNHSHTNGINIELFAKGTVIAPDGAAGVSYWSDDHIEYYSRFPAHNTVVVDGISDYRNMRGNQAFTLNSKYPARNNVSELQGNYTYSDVSFQEPSSGASQQRLTGTVRTSDSSGYFVDIFRSSRNDGKDKKHEYIFHGQGLPLLLKDYNAEVLDTNPTEELASDKGDLKGYDYFNDKRSIAHTDHFRAQFEMPSILDKKLNVNLWMKGYGGRTIFTVEAPYSRAIHQKSVPEALYQKPLPTLIVRQAGEAKSRPFVAIIDAFNNEDKVKVENVTYFSSIKNNPEFIGVTVQSGTNRTDFIYNDEVGKTKHSFKDGGFMGTYGIITYKNETLRSLFLGNGTYIEKGIWKIETSRPNGSILVSENKRGLVVDAKQPFKLTMPISRSAKKTIQLKIIDRLTKQLLSGKVFKKRKQKYVEIELPAIDNGQLEIIYK